MARLARPFALALQLALVAVGLTRDQGTAAAPLEILYLGYGQTGPDAGMARLQSELSGAGVRVSRPFRVRHLRIIDGDERPLRDAVGDDQLRNVALLFAPTFSAARQALGPGMSIPTVFYSAIDPVRAGLVRSLTAPGGAAAGISMADFTHEKRLEILREAVPSIRRVAVLTDSPWLQHFDGGATLVKAAERLGLTLGIANADAPEDLDRLLNDPAFADADAWYVPRTFVADRAEARLIAHMRRIGKPAMFHAADQVARGAQMAYSQDASFVWPTLADLTARVLDGEDPATIPVERPRRYILSVRTGPETNAPPIAPAVIRRADRIY